MSSKYKAKFCTRFVQLGRSAQKMKTLKKNLEGGKIVFTCRNDKLGYNATAKYEKGVYKEGDFVIEKGAQIRINPAPKFLISKPDKYHETWQELMDRSRGTGKIEVPIPCLSPAMAASIVCASVRNGNDEWVDNNWLGDRQHTLGEYLCRETRRRMNDDGDE